MGINQERIESRSEWLSARAPTIKENLNSYRVNHNICRVAACREDTSFEFGHALVSPKFRALNTGCYCGRATV